MVTAEPKNNRLQLNNVPIICNVILINRYGKWIGCGDLRYADFCELQSTLSSDDFIVVAWGRQIGDIISHCIQPYSHTEDIKMAISTACYIITRDKFLGIDRSGYYSNLETVNYAELEIQMVKPEYLQVMLLN